MGRVVHWLRKSGLLTPTARKVAIFTVCCLVVLVALAAKIGNVQLFANRVSYQAQLTDATGLQPSDEVKIAGVTVGQVSSVTVQRAHALVTFAVDSDVHLKADTQVGTQWHNVLGQMYLYLYPGHSSTTLKPGATLPLSADVPGADVGALLNSLQPLLASLNPSQANKVVSAFADALQGDQTEIDQLIGNAATVSQTIGSVDTQVGQVI
ncbi:MAG: MlaD family protein, partial [Acidimicrobiales bacterium]